MAALIDKYMGSKIIEKNCVVLNCGAINSIMYMFYHGTTAYGNYPSLVEYRGLKASKRKIAVFADTGLPLYLACDPEVQKFYFQSLQY